MSFTISPSSSSSTIVTVQKVAQNLVLRLLPREDKVKKVMKLVIKKTKVEMEAWIIQNGEQVSHLLDKQQSVNPELTLKYILLKVLSRIVGKMVEKYKADMDEDDLKEADKCMAKLKSDDDPEDKEKKKGDKKEKKSKGKIPVEKEEKKDEKMESPKVPQRPSRSAYRIPPQSNPKEKYYNI